MESLKETRPRRRRELVHRISVSLKACLQAQGCLHAQHVQGFGDGQNNLVSRLRPRYFVRELTPRSYTRYPVYATKMRAN